ncbi:MAG: twin-arginine translocase subunit TatC [Desulfobulbaceae bacterium]|nr:twin-arginine translocase subunit TatC [Desulfobulbaceae bacterium]
MTSLLAAFRPHYAELRTRLVHAVIAVFLCSALAYIFKDILATWCMQPLQFAYPQAGKLVYTSLPEALLSYIKLSLIAGLMLSFPYLLYQVWMFVTPALLDKEKRLVRQVLLWGTLLFISGASFAFFVVLPRLLQYFMSYAGPNLIPMLKLGAYLTFIARMVLAFALAFEIPFLMVMSVRTGLTSRDHFRDKRLYFYAVITVLAFLLAAGDLTATVLLTVPLVGLYETGILACRLLGRQNTA